VGIEQDACAFDAHIILIWNEVIMGMEQEQTPHKRRVRYKGKYPKKYEEKYKELQPEKYGDTIAHVISKGNTPAGMHRSIMVQEILDFLKIQPGETGFDATLGYGGHTKAMLEQLQGRGHIYATDVDPEESAKTRKRLADAGYGEDILTIKLQNFCTIDEIAKESGGFDFILADLGGGDVHFAAQGVGGNAYDSLVIQIVQITIVAGKTVDNGVRYLLLSHKTDRSFTFAFD